MNPYTLSQGGDVSSQSSSIHRRTSILGINLVFLLPSPWCIWHGWLPHFALAWAPCPPAGWSFGCTSAAVAGRVPSFLPEPQHKPHGRLNTSVSSRNPNLGQYLSKTQPNQNNPCGVYFRVLPRCQTHLQALNSGDAAQLQQPQPAIQLACAGSSTVEPHLPVPVQVSQASPEAFG